MTTEQIIQKISTVLSHIGYPSSGVPAIIRDWESRKARLSGLLGLASANSWRRGVPLPSPEQNRPMERHFLEAVCKHLDLEYLDLRYARRGNSHIRLARLIRSRWKEVLPLLGSFPGIADNMYMYAIKENLPLSDHRVAEVFLADFGERITSRHGWISVNPLDFFTMSGGKDQPWAGFASCARPGGSAFATAASLVTTPFALLFYTTNLPDSNAAKTGRCQLYLLPDCLVTARSYGICYPSDLAAVRTLLGDLLSVSFSSESLGCLDSGHVTSPRGIHIDITHTEIYPVEGREPQPKPHFDQPRCLGCGIEDTNGNGLCMHCYASSSRICAWCCRIGADQPVTGPNGQAWIVCRSCRERVYAACCLCQGAFHRTVLTQVSGINRYICPDCNEGVAICLQCRKLIALPPVFLTHYGYRCRECIKLHTGDFVKSDNTGSIACHECDTPLPRHTSPRLAMTWTDRKGRYTSRPQAVPVCESCYTDHYSACRECLSVYRTKSMHISDPKVRWRTCPACAGLQPPGLAAPSSPGEVFTPGTVC